MKYWTQEQAAKHYGVTVRTIRRWLAAGTIKKRAGIGRTVQVPTGQILSGTRKRRRIKDGTT